MQSISHSKPAFLYPKIEIAPIKHTIQPNETYKIPFNDLSNSRIIVEILAGLENKTSNYYFRCIFMRIFHNESIILQHNEPVTSSFNMIPLEINYDSTGIEIKNTNSDIVTLNFKIDNFIL